MRDERLAAGRHHLDAGTEALGTRAFEEAEQAFRSALIQFAGPDLKIGAAHALRGLATVQLSQGHTVPAEAYLRDAVRQYRDVRKQLDQLDDTGVSAEIRNQALQGEAVTQVLLGDLLIRTGRDHEAREARDWARAAFDGVAKGPAIAGLHALTGRLAARDGELDEAKTAYRMAATVYERAGDGAGRAGVLQAIAEIARLEGDLPQAEKLLSDSRQLARDAGDRAGELRALAGLGSLAMHAGDPESGILAYDQVLAVAHQLHDDEMLGFAHLNLGQLRSITRRGDPLMHLREAVRILGGLGISHGVGAALHHVATHALANERPAFALAAAEGARRLWRSMDPTRGVGQAMRLQVKALAALDEPRALLAVAYARANLVGDHNPKAIEVRDHYRRRADPLWVESLESKDATTLFRTAEEHVRAVLNPFLLGHGWTVSELTVTSQALALIDVLHQLERDEPAENLPPLPADALEAVEGELPYFVLSEDEAETLSAVPPEDPDA